MSECKRCECGDCEQSRSDHSFYTKKLQDRAVKLLGIKGNLVGGWFEILDELEKVVNRLEQLDASHKEWSDKTEWMNNTAAAKELGMHRADVLKHRIKNQDTLLKDLYLITPGQPGCGDFSREQRTRADLLRYITGNPNEH